MVRTAVIPGLPTGRLEAVAVALPSDARAVPAGLAAVDACSGGALGAACRTGDLAGALGPCTVVHGAAKSRCARVLVVPLPKTATPDTVRTAAASAARAADRLGVRSLVLVGFADLLGAKHQAAACRAAADGAVTGPWLDLRWRKARGPEGKAGALKTVQFVAAGAANRVAAAEGDAIGQAANWARDVGNAPANLMTPTAFANAARKMAAGRRRLRVRVLPEAALRRLKMGALLGVAQGSANPPCLVVAEYRGGRGAPIALVGKGVMFDTGGISIKPSEGMDKMKMDMCGGAGVMGAIRAAADLSLPLNLVAVVPAVENMPDGKAQRPGDIVRACNGVTIEVLNTDAEGRLILADALAWTEKTHRPRAMVDMATLTGAVVIALGRHCLGVMGTDDKLVRGLIDAGEATGERAWELPLWDAYLADAKSPIADVKNIGPPRQAGTIMGAAFLKHFVGATPWAHLDIAATAWHESGPAVGPTGAGVRLLTEWLCREAGRRKGGKPQGGKP